METTQISLNSSQDNDIQLKHGISECDTVEKLCYSAGFEPMCAPLIHTFHSIAPVSEVFAATCIKLVPQLLIFNAIINDNDPHTLMV